MIRNTKAIPKPVKGQCSKVVNHYVFAFLAHQYIRLTVEAMYTVTGACCLRSISTLLAPVLPWTQTLFMPQPVSQVDEGQALVINLFTLNVKNRHFRSDSVYVFICRRMPGAG